MSAPHDRYMDRLHIRDFRSFAGEYDLDVGGDVVLVYGPNSAAKTTINHAKEYALMAESMTSPLPYGLSTVSGPRELTRPPSPFRA